MAGGWQEDGGPGGLTKGFREQPSRVAGSSGCGEVRRQARQRDYVARGEDSSMALRERGDGGREVGRMGSHSCFQVFLV